MVQEFDENFQDQDSELKCIALYKEEDGQKIYYWNLAFKDSKLKVEHLPDGSLTPGNSTFDMHLDSLLSENDDAFRVIEFFSVADPGYHK